MPRRFSLAHLTVLSVPPPEMVYLAARCGYDAVGLRLIAVTADSPGYPLMSDAAMMRAAKAACRDTGVKVHDIEFIKITPELDVAALEPFVAAGADLGAKQIVTAPYDPDLPRLAAKLHAVASLAAGYGLGTVLEFFPWTVVPNLGAARRMIEAAAHPNLGILVDTLHFARSDSKLEELAVLPPGMVPFVHVCDAPPGIPTSIEGLLHTARAERLPPGEGAIGIKAILAHMPAGIPAGLEVPMDAMTRAEGPEAVAARVIAAARRLLG